MLVNVVNNFLKFLKKILRVHTVLQFLKITNSWSEIFNNARNNTILGIENAQKLGNTFSIKEQIF